MLQDNVLKKNMERLMKKILLINEKKEFENVSAGWPHLGLVSIATVLKRAGFTVRVIDYAFLKNSQPLNNIIKIYNPDVIGFSLYTTTWSKYDKILNDIERVFKGVVIVGGPHATLYYKDLLEDKRIDYIFKGEAEEKIVEVCSKCVKNEIPEIIECGFVDVKEMEWIDYSVADQYEKIEEVGIQLERGCPFNCSFCSVRKISSRRVRYRKIQTCIQELHECKKIMPKLESVRIVDDCPSFHLEKFKEFVRAFIQDFPELRINIQHLRADQVDEEMLLLLKKARVRSFTLGVESANPEVFKYVDKGESLEEIEQTALLVKKIGVPLTLAFVIGLPESTYEKEKDSLDFAKRIKPREIYWNMCLPHKGTRVWDWYQENGTIYEGRNPSTLIDFNLEFDSPRAETPQFSIYERERAWVRAVLETKSFRFRFSLLPRIFELGRKYELMPSVASLFLNSNNLKLICRDIALHILKSTGLLETVRRYWYTFKYQ